MSSTEHDILRSVDDGFNRIDGKPCFRYVAHKTMKIAIRIDADGNQGAMDKNTLAFLYESKSVLLLALKSILSFSGFQHVTDCHE